MGGSSFMEREFGKTASPAPFRNERSGGESVWLLG